MVKKALIHIIVIMCVYTSSWASVLFQDNFDSQADFTPDCLQCGNDYNGYNGGYEHTPTGWTYWNNYELWSETAGGPSGTKPSIRITNEHTPTGKSLICTNESNQGTGDGWGSDGILMKYLGESGYSELNVRFTIKYQPGFKRHWNSIMNAAIKTVRIMRYEGGGSAFLFFETGYTFPIAIIDMIEDQWSGGGAYLTTRCDPTASYFCNETSLRSQFVDENCDAVSGYLYQGNYTEATDDSSVGVWDSGEHTFVMRVVMNSTPGATDGIYELYEDGCLLTSSTVKSYVRSGGSTTQGWNMVGFGGNAFNNYAGITNHTYATGAEQWYSIDGVYVTTTLQEALDGPGDPPTYDQPTIAGPDDFSTTAPSVEIEGTCTVDSELTVDTATWTLGEDSGFCVVVLGVFTCTVPVEIGTNNIVFEIVDSNSGTDSDTTIVTRTLPSTHTVVTHGNIGLHKLILH